MKESFNKKVKIPFMFDVYCFRSYSEDGVEYWSEGSTYEAARDGNIWYIKTNFNGVGIVGEGYSIDDLDDYFIYLS